VKEKPTDRREKEEIMRRTRVILALLLVVLVGTAIGIGAYHAGVSHGLTEAGHASRIVRVVGPGAGWFPFGFLLFPLFFFLVVGLIVRPLVWRHRWAGGGQGHWERHGPEGRGAMFEDWHRRQHEQAAGDHPGSGGEPART
jgi:hypothetical protein